MREGLIQDTLILLRNLKFWILRCCPKIIFLLSYKLAPRAHFVLVIVLSILSILSQRFVAIPFAIQDSFIGAAFISIGFYSKEKVKSILACLESKRLSYSIILTVFFGIILDIVEKNFPHQWMNLGSNSFHYQVIISSLIGFCFLLSGSVLISKVRMFDEFLNFIGKNSFWILIIHNYDILLIRDWNKMSWQFISLTLLLYPFILYSVQRLTVRDK